MYVVDYVLEIWATALETIFDIPTRVSSYAVVTVVSCFPRSHALSTGAGAHQLQASVSNCACHGCELLHQDTDAILLFVHAFWESPL